MMKFTRTQFDEAKIKAELEGSRGDNPAWVVDGIEAIHTACKIGLALYFGEDSQHYIESPTYDDDPETGERTETIWLQTITDYNLDDGDYECRLEDAEIED